MGVAGNGLQRFLSTETPFFVAIMLFWLSLYVFVRGSPRRTMRLLALSVMLVSCYFVHVALVRTSNVETADLWIRLMWPTTPLAIAVWLHTVSKLGEEEKAPAQWVRPALYLGIYPAAILLGLLGSIGELLFNYAGAAASPLPWEGYHVPPGPYYWTFTAFLALTLGLAEYRLVQLYHRTRGQARQRFLYLLIGTAVTAAGALYLSVDILGGTPWSEWPGEMIMAAGLFVVAYEAITYETGLHLRTDFLYSAIRTLGAAAIYVGTVALMIELINLSPLLPLLAVAILAVFSHTLYGAAAGWLDRIFLSDETRRERAEKRGLYQAVTTKPVQEETDLRELSDEELLRLVREAVGDLCNIPALAQSPLVGLHLVRQRLLAKEESLSPAGRATMLQTILLELIEELRPKGNNHILTESGRNFVVLYYDCYHKLDRYRATPEEKRILDFLQSVSRRTVNRWQLEACSLISAQLRQLEKEAHEAPAERFSGGTPAGAGPRDRCTGQKVGPGKQEGARWRGPMGRPLPRP